MNPTLLADCCEAQLAETNRNFYDRLWADARLITPDSFNTWPLVNSLLPNAKKRLEIGPGLRPRLPIQGTHFVDISYPAVSKLQSQGGIVEIGSIMELPFPDQSFDLICALDILEHVEDDSRALSELARICEPGAAFLVATPLYMSRWTGFDDFVGHCRRYEPQDFIEKLALHGFTIEQSAVYGMQPKNSRILDAGVWWMIHHRERAMWWWNNVMMPLGIRFQKKLVLSPGLIDTTKVDEIFLLCRKTQGRLRSL